MGVSRIFCNFGNHLHRFCLDPFSRFALLTRQFTPFLVPISSPQVVLFPVTVIARYSSALRAAQKAPLRVLRGRIPKIPSFPSSNRLDHRCLVNQSGTSNKQCSSKCEYLIVSTVSGPRLHSFGAYLIPWTSPLSSIHFDLLDYLQPFPSPPPTLGGGT